MHKIRHYQVLCGILLMGCTVLTCCFFKQNIVFTSNTMSLTYSHSASSFPLSKEMFYVNNNTLYFSTESGKIRYIKNNIVRTFTTLPDKWERFIILDDKSAIVQINNSIHLLNTADGKIQELWQGGCVGYYEDRVYFTDNTTLYAASIGAPEPQAVVSFDELLASYNGEIVYRNSDGIYKLLLEQLHKPQLLITDDIPWQDDITAWLVDYTYLYASDYALRISSRALDMYTYKTGELQRIYEADTDSMVLMAVTAGKNTLYVSSQCVDFKYCQINDNAINGTYKYDIKEDAWSKITDKVYDVTAQFDEQYLYGIDLDTIFRSGISKIKKFQKNY